MRGRLPTDPPLPTWGPEGGVGQGNTGHKVKGRGAPEQGCSSRVICPLPTVPAYPLTGGHTGTGSTWQGR